MFKKIILTDGEISKEVRVGYDFLFLVSFLLILPIPFYFIYQKQNKAILSSVVILYILLPTGIFILDQVPHIGFSLSIILYTIILIYIFFIVPSSLYKWKINKYYKMGFIECKSNKASDQEIFKNAINHNSFVGKVLG